MAKTIYVYFNTNDLTELLNNLQQKGIPLFDNEQRQILNLPFAVKNYIEIGLYSQDNGCVIFSPCWFSDNRLDYGWFCLTNENDCPASSKLFSQIKRIVRKIFFYSKESATYYGSGFYNDWLNKRYCLPIQLDCERITLTVDEIEHLFSTLRNTTFCIKPNLVRLRDVDKVDLSIPSFIIYSDSSQLMRTIIRKAFIRYEYDSACIFAYKDERKGIYSLEFDRRLSKEFPELKSLFESLKTQDSSAF